MYIGSLFIRSGGVSYYSPTFPRGGLAGLFQLEIFAMHGSSVTLECLVEHKNAEDTSFATAATFASMTTTGLKQVNATALKEEIRLNITVGGAADSNTVYANVLAPTWRPY